MKRLRILIVGGTFDRDGLRTYQKDSHKYYQ